MIKIGLERTKHTWEKKREKRINLEKKYIHYTGNITVVELHIPYPYYDEVEKIFNEDIKKQGKKMLVINGDAVNFDLFSVFKNTSTDNSLPSVEVKDFIKLLRVASKVYDDIIYVMANHDARLKKVLSYSVADKQQSREIEYFMSTFEDMFEEEGIKLCVSPLFLFQVGNVLFMHVEENSENLYLLAKKLWEKFITRIEKPWVVIFQSHVHRQGDITINGIKVIFTGALIDRMDYAQAGKVKYSYSTIGYGVCYMKNGNVDWNTCHYMTVKKESFI